jgi:hypothetical protein
MNTAEILAELADVHPDCLKAEGFDDAIVSVVSRCGQPDVICYDYQKCVEILMGQGMDEVDAVEYLSFNVIGAYVGEYTPMFLFNWRNDDVSQS